MYVHNNFAIKFPNIAIEWDYQKNIGLPQDFLPGSDFNAWWKCSKSTCMCHIYESQIKTRTGGSGCPYCANQKICPHNNLLHKYPNIIKIWDYNKNQEGPEKYSPASDQKVWRTCEYGHSYQMMISCKMKRYIVKCSMCGGSSGEQLIGSVLKSLGIKYEREWKFNYIPRRRFDFYFNYNDTKWILEYDGQQHFDEIQMYHPHSGDFEFHQEIDRIKTFVACHTGHKVIRIDYGVVDEAIAYSHIIKALELNQNIYYSDNDLYRWLSEGIISEEAMKREDINFWNKYINK